MLTTQFGEALLIFIICLIFFLCWHSLKSDHLDSHFSNANRQRGVEFIQLKPGKLHMPGISNRGLNDRVLVVQIESGMLQEPQRRLKGTGEAQGGSVWCVHIRKPPSTPGQSPKPYTCSINGRDLLTQEPLARSFSISRNWWLLLSLQVPAQTHTPATQETANIDHGCSPWDSRLLPNISAIQAEVTGMTAGQGSGKGSLWTSSPGDFRKAGVEHRDVTRSPDNTG